MINAIYREFDSSFFLSFPPSFFLPPSLPFSSLSLPSLLIFMSLLTPVLLPGKSHGQRSLVGCSPWGREESDMIERLPFHFSLSCIREGNGNPLQYSCLENPRDRGTWWVSVYGVAQSRTRLKRLSSSSRHFWEPEIVSIFVTKNTKLKWLFDNLLIKPSIPQFYYTVPYFPYFLLNQCFPTILSPKSLPSPLLPNTFKGSVHVYSSAGAS